MAKGNRQAETLLRAGFAAHQAGQLDTAEARYRAALAQNPDLPDALNLLGVIRRAKGDAAEAVRLQEKALKLAPGAIDTRGNFANALVQDGQYARAAAEVRTMLAARPAQADAWATLGRALKFLGDREGSVAAFDRAIALAAARADYPFERALARLMLGDYPAGFADYESRWLQPHLKPHRATLNAPEWDGADPRGKVILAVGEQGFGDSIMFARYLPLLAARGAQPVLVAQTELEALMAGLAGPVRIHPNGTALPPIDAYCHLGTLPLRFGATIDTVPGAPYLAADPARTARWRERLGPRDGRLRVGLVWAGRSSFAEDRNRSPRLGALAPLLAVEGVAFYGLQMGDGRADLAGFAAPAGFTDLGAGIGDFADTAAIMASLDLVISSCTAPAHLAGALGRPLWVLLSDAADWRWLRGRADSPWYPTARLFRQTRLGDWSVLVAEAVAALRDLAATRG